MTILYLFLEINTLPNSLPNKYPTKYPTAKSFVKFNSKRSPSNLTLCN